jgi:copper chaperone
MKQVTFQLETLTCPSCVRKIETAFSRLDGVSETKVQFHSSKVLVAFEEETIPASQLQHALTQMGYPVLRMTEKELKQV